MPDPSALPDKRATADTLAPEPVLIARPSQPAAGLSTLSRIGIFAAIAAPIALLPYFLNRRAIASLRREVKHSARIQSKLQEELRRYSAEMGSTSTQLQRRYDTIFQDIGALEHAWKDHDGRMHVLTGRLDAMSGTRKDDIGRDDRPDLSPEAQHSDMKESMTTLVTELLARIKAEHTVETCLMELEDKQRRDADELKRAVTEMEILTHLPAEQLSVEVAGIRSEVADVVRRLDVVDSEKDFDHKVDALGEKVQELASLLDTETKSLGDRLGTLEGVSSATTSNERERHLATLKVLEILLSEMAAFMEEMGRTIGLSNFVGQANSLRTMARRLRDTLGEGK